MTVAQRPSAILITWIIPALLLVVGCDRYGVAEDGGGFGSGQTEIRHPLPDLLESTRTSVPVSTADFVELTPSSAPGLRSLARFPSERAIGTMGGGGPDELGVITDAAVSSRGEVILLDRSHGSLRVFDSTGTPLQTLAGYGGGPGEFVDPWSIAFGLHDTLLVADHERTIHRFVRRQRDWEYHDQLHMDFMPVSVCSAGGRTFAAGLRITQEPDSPRFGFVSLGTTHEIDPIGDVVQSFATPYRSDSFLALVTLHTELELACDLSNDRLWVGFQLLGEVHAYTTEGSLLWITRLGGFRFPGLLERPTEGSIRLYPADDPRIDAVSNITYLSAGALLVEVESRPRAGASEISRRFYILDPSTGEGKGVVEGHGVIGGRFNRAVLYREDPFPQFAVVELRSGR